MPRCAQRLGTGSTLWESIYQRGNRYWIKFRDLETRRLIRRSAGDSYAEALTALAEAEGMPVDSGLPFAQIWESYRSHLRTHAKARSVSHVERIGKRLLKHFGTRDVRSLNSTDVDRLILARQKQGVKPKTINADLAYLRAIFNHGVRAGLLESLPVRIRLLKAPRKRVLPILQPEDIRALLKHAGEPYYGILLISAHTGFRLDETLHLMWGDVLWKEGKLAITGKNGWESKSYQERAVYVAPEVLTYLKRVRIGSRFKHSQDYVFSTRNRTPVSVTNACRGFRKVFAQAGLYQKGRPLDLPGDFRTD